MPWLITLFVIVPLILVAQKTFEHGYGGLILVPIFGLFALLPFLYAWRKCSSVGFAGAVVTRAICLAVFAYLGKQVYIGALPTWEFPTVPPGHLRGDEAASITGWGGLIVIWAVTFLLILREGKAESRKP